MEKLGHIEKKVLLPVDKRDRKKMSTIKYTVVKSRQQYDEYCRILEHLVERDDESQDVRDEIELITFLIEKGDYPDSFRVFQSFSGRI